MESLAGDLGACGAYADSMASMDGAVRECVAHASALVSPKAASQLPFLSESELSAMPMGDAVAPRTKGYDPEDKELVAKVRQCFAEPSAEGILKALREEGSAWAKGCEEQMRRASPLALTASLRLLENGLQGDWASAIVREHRVLSNIAAQPDLRAHLEGRAEWTHGSVEEVSLAEVDELFRELPDGQELSEEDFRSQRGGRRARASG